jgi:hypothetical protein
MIQRKRRQVFCHAAVTIVLCNGEMEFFCEVRTEVLYTAWFSVVQFNCGHSHASYLAKWLRKRKKKKKQLGFKT